LLVSTALGLAGCGDDDETGTGGSGAAGLTTTGSSGESTTNTTTGAGSTSSAGGGSGGGVVEPGLEVLELGLPVDLTPDGSIALIEDISSPTAELYFFDTVSKELTLKTELGDPLRNLATAISATGHISAFQGEPVQAALWSEDDDWRHIASPFPAGCDQDFGAGFDVTADGTIVVGMLWNGCAPEAFLWTDDGGDGVLTALEVLGEPFEGSTLAPSNRATVVSDDGLVIAGFAQNGPVDRSPAVWYPDGSGFLLDPSNQDAPGEVLSISADGSVIAGIWGNLGFLWTEADGVVDLGTLPIALPSDPVYPNAIAADGALIFGGVGNPFFGIPAAFVWTPEQGMRSLADIVSANGITIPDGQFLTSVLAASEDGSIVLGATMDELGTQRTFVLTLPVSAYE
jgi:hypothetical protein